MIPILCAICIVGLFCAMCKTAQDDPNEPGPDDTDTPDPDIFHLDP